jgi:tetratricopeptide (TPR) repeat protein
MESKQIYIKGTEAFASCDYEQALSLFLSILDSNPYDDNLILRISQCYQEMARYNEAIEFLERLLDINMNKGNLKRAIAVCKRILSIDPDDTEVILKLANIFRRLKQYGEASNYYKIVAQHYEYAGFLDKAIEVLQIIKDIGYEGIEDILEMVKKEYKRGAKDKVNQSIDSIISDLKQGNEYVLLDVALNLALSNSPEHLDYTVELAEMYFKSGKLFYCMHLSLWALRIEPGSSPAIKLLVKTLWALGYRELADRVCNAIINGEWPYFEDKKAVDEIKRMHSIIMGYELNRLKVHEKILKDDRLSVDSEALAYLSSYDVENIDHKKIEHELLMKDIEDRLQDATDEKTSIIDIKKQYRVSPEVFNTLREAEILVSEGLYDKALQSLLKLLEHDPGNKQGRELLDKVVKMSDGLSSVDMLARVQLLDRITDDMIGELETYLKHKDLQIELNQDNDDQMAIGNIVGSFNNKIQDILIPNDYKTIFDLGIAYMELELWKEAEASFRRVVDYLSLNAVDNEKLMEAKIYYSYSLSKKGISTEVNKAIEVLKGMLTQDISEKHKMNVLYYLAQCYEISGDIAGARNSYKQIIDAEPSYRDVEVRLSVIGK